MSNSIHRKYEEKFQLAYNKLNEQQNKAVDQIEGPVAVIAGPGTGKTQILAIRIGRILQLTDAQAHNILCLTYTEAATTAMRNRLVEIIGPEAHKIHIYTFHGFANQVIQENLDVFGNYRQLEAITDLEKIDVFDQLLDELPNDHILKRLKGNPRYEGKRMSNLFSMMKKENLTASDVHTRIDEYLARLKTDEVLANENKLIAGKKVTTKDGTVYLKGDFREDKYKEICKKYKETRAAAEQLQNYNKILSAKGRYDFEDMISWVVNGFLDHEDLLPQYQERYHYFLVDEFQDTNGSQNKLLELLIQFWEDSPNVFVVGDPDQAIYKFQGASEKNISDFNEKYHPEVIKLLKNYRSNQSILDSATALINYPMIFDPSKYHDQELRRLEAAGKYKDEINEPAIYFYENPVHELAHIATTIVKLSETNTDLSKYAVLYRKHRQIDKLIQVLEKKNIPFNIKKKVDILKDPLVDNLLNILFYIQSEYEKPNSEEVRLFEMMHYHFFNIGAREIAKITIHLRAERKAESIRDVMSNKKLLEEIGVNNISEIARLNDLLSKWTSDIVNVTIQSLFENILNESGILQTVLQHPDKSWQLQLIGTLFDFLKEETSKAPEIALKEFLSTITKMKEEDLSLQINKITYSNNGINFITTHSAKGLEFEKVFIIGCTKDVWDKNLGMRNSYTLPDNISSNSKNTIDDERRLFYVAMTRAEKYLQLSYSLHNEGGKDLGASQFIDEVLSETELVAKKQEVDSDIITEFQALTFLKTEKEIQLIDHDLIDKVLSKYQLSVTGLNKYLRCKMSFYFEDILRVPSARTAYTGFGKSVHLALQKYYGDISKGTQATLDRLLLYFSESMSRYKSHFTKSEFKDLNAYGKKTLKEYYEHYLVEEVHAKSYVLEHAITKAEYNGIPIKGILDKVSVYNDYVEVVDYKTGNAKKTTTAANLREPNDKKPEGGDYWRQIVFYKLLLDSDKKHNWNMVSGFMDFVEPDRKTKEFVRRKFVVTPDHINLVGEQIESTWQKIQDHDFNNLCENEKCYWCNFVRNDYVFNDDMVDDLEPDIEFTSFE